MWFEFVFGIILIVLIIFIYLYSRVRIKLKETRFQKYSLSTKYGKMTEQFIPFMKDYPYNENNFRFIGTPIDGVQFEDDKIVFMEFKIGSSNLTERQKKIRDLVKKRKVDFKEIRIS